MLLFQTRNIVGVVAVSEYEPREEYESTGSIGAVSKPPGERAENKALPIPGNEAKSMPYEDFPTGNKSL